MDMNLAPSRRVWRGLVRLIVALLAIPALVGITVLVYRSAPASIGALAVVAALALLITTLTRMVME